MKFRLKKLEHYNMLLYVETNGGDELPPSVYKAAGVNYGDTVLIRVYLSYKPSLGLTTDEVCLRLGSGNFERVLREMSAEFLQELNEFVNSVIEDGASYENAVKAAREERKLKDV